MTRIPAQRTDDADAQALDSWAVVQRVQAGDTEAYAILYSRYKGTVARFVNSRVSRMDAEDFTQAVFLRGLRYINSFKWQGQDFGAWLITMARNLICDWSRSATYKRERVIGDFAEAGIDTAAVDPWSCPEEFATDRVDTDVMVRQLRPGLARLTAEQREVLRLRMVEGLPIADVAARLGKNIGAVKALQYRATLTLAAHMEAMR